MWSMGSLLHATSVFTKSMRRINVLWWDVYTRVCCKYDMFRNILYTTGKTRCALTYWGRDQIDAISQTTFWSAFSWMKMFEFQLKFHWSLFLRFQWQGDKPLSEPMLVRLPTHICVTRPQWFEEQIGRIKWINTILTGCLLGALELAQLMTNYQQLSWCILSFGNCTCVESFPRVKTYSLVPVNNTHEPNQPHDLRWTERRGYISLETKKDENWREQHVSWSTNI